MTSMKTYFLTGLIGLTSVMTLSACGGQSTSSNDTISVISREEGSGTRGAFVELFGVEEEQNGEKVDMTSPSAIVTNSTAVMLTTVAGDKNAIGYVSLGSLDDTVQVEKIDGVEASIDSIKDGSYKISRPFNIVTTEKVSKEASDFMAFIMSDQGQKVVEESGYIPNDSPSSYQLTVSTGKITVSGSSSVTPVMEKLKEAYLKVNPGMTVEVQQSDSSTGVTDAIDGTSDIGMASRELKDTEIEKGAKATVIATDGIAVITNKENSIDDLTSEEVKAIYTGETSQWSDLEK